MAVFGRFLSLNFELGTTFFLPATVPRSIAGRRAAPLHLLLRNAAALQKWLRDSPGLTRKKAQTVLGKLDMTSPESLPNGRILLERMALSPERLKSGSRAAVSLTILKAILSIAASKIPFDPEFYLATYPDIREAHKSGRITDLVSHFVETGVL